MNDDEPTPFCEFAPIDGRLLCSRCNRELPGSLALPVYRACTGPKPHAPPAPAVVLIANDLARGPCVHRGELVAVERCRIGCQRDKEIETFACLPDAGCEGPPSIASEAQWSHAQTLNRRREICAWCVRYRPRLEIPNAASDGP